MSSQRTNQTRPHLVVVGASGAVGREVCRLAVAYGCDVIGACRSGTPPVDEPWTAGVEWVEYDVSGAEELALPADLVAIVDATPSQVRGKLRDLDAKVVEIGCSTEILSSSPPPSHVVLLLSPPFDRAVERGDAPPSDRGIALSHAAMAGLRGALEDEHSGILSPAEVAHLGDAMFFQ